MEKVGWDGNQSKSLAYNEWNGIEKLWNWLQDDPNLCQDLETV